MKETNDEHPPIHKPTSFLIRVVEETTTSFVRKLC